MVKIDLITGFLGSGKTTFLKGYAKYLAKAGERVGIIENDYGAINVDMMLLSELKALGIGLEMVAGGCDADCHRRRFKTKLITMAMLGYTRVIVEPSGIFDTDEFFDLLNEDPLYDRYEIGNVLAIVNAEDEHLSENGEYLLASQCASAGRIIFSFAEDRTLQEIEERKAYIRDALKKIQCRRIPGDDVFFVKKGKYLSDQDYEYLRHSGYCETGFVKLLTMDDNTFEALFFMNPKGKKEEILKAASELWDSSEAGRILRMKGFVQDEAGWLQINLTKDSSETERIAEGQSVIIVIGENLNASVIDSYFDAQYSTLRTQ